MTQNMHTHIYVHGTFQNWYSKLDKTEKKIVLVALTKVKLGNLQNCKPLQNVQGLQEIKMRSGHRVYFGNDKQNNIRLIIGGSIKRDQNRVIKIAKKHWMEYQSKGTNHRKQLSKPLELK